MPLFHSNSLMVGWAPSIVVGASVGLARRFTVSGFLPDVRRYGATWFNYTGKPLSYLLARPSGPTTRDNPLRVAFGNEGSPAVLDEFARRFGVEVIDAFGSTEGAIALEPRRPRPGRARWASPGRPCKIVDETGEECPPAEFDADGQLVNADECVGEIVNTAGAGPFEGYYNNPEATDRRHSQRVVLVGRPRLPRRGPVPLLRRSDRRLDPRRRRELPGRADRRRDRRPSRRRGGRGLRRARRRSRRPGDGGGGASRDGAAFDPDGFAALASTSEAGLGPKWRPRYVRVATELPTTGTNKVVTRTLAAPEVPPRPSRGRRVVGPASWRRRLPALHRDR